VTGLAVTALVAAWVPRLSAGRARKLRLLAGGLVAVGGLLTGAGLFGGAPAAPALPRLPTEGELAALARTVGDSPELLVAAILGAFAWGAGHALTPGHGKALVGAYLVGSRGTPGQAVLLGGLVTLTHTLGVFALGGVVWLAAGSLDQERLSPWLSLISGLGVAGVGIGLFLGRLRGLGLGHGHSHGGASHSHGGLTHSHGGLAHSHGGLPLDRQKPGRRTLFALGVSGGLVPCPGALVLLLGAVAVGRIGLGLALVAAFSLGLATVLTAVGLLFLKGARFLENAPAFAVAARWLPVAAALAVTGLGLALTVEAGRSLLGG
jgi:ABC-type nickel/cobalt efflux system permease component RcnA